MMLPQGLGHHPRGLPARGAAQGVRRVRPGDGLGGDDRPDPRRRPDRAGPVRLRLADGLPDQPAARDRALAGACALLPRTAPGTPPRLDLAGAVLSAVAALAIVYPLIQGRELGWPAWTYATMAAGVALLGVLRPAPAPRGGAGPDPLIEPSIFRHRGYSAGALVLLLFFGGMIGSMLAITLFLQLGEGFSAIHAGLTLAPFALGTGDHRPAGRPADDHRLGPALIQAGAADLTDRLHRPGGDPRRHRPRLDLGPARPAAGRRAGHGPVHRPGVRHRSSPRSPTRRPARPRAC